MKYNLVLRTCIVFFSKASVEQVNLALMATTAHTVSVMLTKSKTERKTGSDWEDPPSHVALQ